MVTKYNKYCTICTESIKVQITLHSYLFFNYFPKLLQKDGHYLTTYSYIPCIIANVQWKFVTWAVTVLCNRDKYVVLKIILTCVMACNSIHIKFIQLHTGTWLVFAWHISKRLIIHLATVIKPNHWRSSKLSCLWQNGYVSFKSRSC